MDFNSNRLFHLVYRNNRPIPTVSETSHISNSASRQIMFEAYATNNPDASEYEKSVESEFNIPGLRKETERLILRCHKKIGKANERYNKSVRIMEELLTKEDATDEELNACPNVDALEEDLEVLRGRLKKLRTVEEAIASTNENIPKKGSIVLPDDLAALVVELEINDAPPERKPSFRKRKKNNNGDGGPRKPYRRYFSKDNVEIRVGKKAEDNDELSCNPTHRDGPDWWMHAAGCPGSHVVIRCHDNNLDKFVVMDAAALAARQSKCNGGTIKVSLFSCVFKIRSLIKSYTS